MTRYVDPFIQYSDGVGAVLPGSQLSFFEPGTTVFKDTFIDEAFTTANINPIVSDGEGRFGPIFLDGSYAVALRDRNLVIIGTADPIGELSDDDFIITVSYSEGDTVTGSDGMTYISLVDFNIGIDPVTTPLAGLWRAFDQPRSSSFTNADMLVVDYSPPVEVLTRGLNVSALGPAANNLSSTPSFRANDTVASTIIHPDGLPIAPADIGGASHMLNLHFNGANWVLNNPIYANRQLSNLASPGLRTAAWVRFSTITGAISSSFNISGVVTSGTGSATITFDTPFPNLEYLFILYANNNAFGVEIISPARSVSTFNLVTGLNGFSAPVADVNAIFYSAT